MIRAALPLLACVAGCGRLDFGEVSGPDGGDGSDAMDYCPHVPGTNADSDGDEVGDVCDPNPTTPGDHIRVFSPLTPGTSPFVDLMGCTEEAAGIHCVGDTALTIQQPSAHTRIEIGFEILAILGSGQHQVAVGAEGTTPYYFTELNENGPTIHQVALFAYDGTNGYVPLDVVDMPGMHTGHGMMRLDTNATTRKFAALAGWDGELYMSSAATPMFTGGVAFRYALNGLDLRINYIIVIDSP